MYNIWTLVFLTLCFYYYYFLKTFRPRIFFLQNIKKMIKYKFDKFYVTHIVRKTVNYRSGYEFVEIILREY